MKEEYWLITYKDIWSNGTPNVTETFKGESWTRFVARKGISRILFLKEITKEEYDNSPF